MTREELIALKKSIGISVTKLSELSGVPVGTINKIITGETKNPRPDTVRALKKVLCDGGPSDMYPYDCENGNGYLPASGADFLCERALSYGVPKKKQGEYRFEDLDCLPEGAYAELIDGYIYDMATPTYVHQRIAMEVYDQIRDYIKKKGGPCEAFVNAFGVFADNDDKTYVIPDLSIVCDDNKIKNKGIYGAPDFVLEILSPSTATKDTGHKCFKYATCGVKEYWVIDPKGKRIMAYRLTNNVSTFIGPLEGGLGVAIYNEELKINLDELSKIIDDNINRE